MKNNDFNNIRELLSDEILLYKFLSSVRGNTNPQPPANFTDDIIQGIYYVFSCLKQIYAIY